MTVKRSGITLVSALVLILITGCSTVPQGIREVPAENLQMIDVHPNVQAYSGKIVRWGDEIIATQNAGNKTTIEVLQYPLKNNGKPKRNSLSDGCFMVTVDRFLAPATFRAKRLFTAKGSLDSEISGAIGDQPYQFPLVAAETETFYLWPTDFSPYYGYSYYFPSYGYWRFYLNWGVRHKGYHGSLNHLLQQHLKHYSHH